MRFELSDIEKMGRTELLEVIRKQDEIIKCYNDALGEIGDLVTDPNEERIISKVLGIEREAEKKVGAIRTGNPFYGKVVQVKVDLEHKELEGIGYKFNVLEAGYVSPDKATIVLTHREGQKRKVVQYRPDDAKEHVRNVEELIKHGLIEN